jgi:8-oxo-dGTP diphosphatase
MPYTYPYPRPALTVDCLITRLHKGHKQCLLICRKHDPYRNKWALPGGFVNIDEKLADAARRELWEETGLKISLLEQFHVFDEPGRDPRGRTITVVFTGDLDYSKSSVKASSDAKEAKWFFLDKLPELAFDHRDIIDLALYHNRI